MAVRVCSVQKERFYLSYTFARSLTYPCLWTSEWPELLLQLLAAFLGEQVVEQWLQFCVVLGDYFCAIPRMLELESANQALNSDLLKPSFISAKLYQRWLVQTLTLSVRVSFWCFLLTFVLGVLLPTLCLSKLPCSDCNLNLAGFLLEIWQ